MSPATMPLREVLEHQPYDDLLTIGRTWGIELRGTPPRKLLAERVAKAMLNPAMLAQRVTTMPEPVQRAQAALVRTGTMARADFERSFGRIESRREPGHPFPPDLSPADALHATGFALLAKDNRGGEQVVMPRDLAAAISSVLTSTFETLLRRHSPPPAARVVDEADHVVARTAAVLSYALQHGLQRTKSGDVNKVYLNKLTDHVYGKGAKDAPEAPGPHPLTLFSLLTLAGVIRARGESGIELGQSGRSFLSGSRLDQLKALFTAWQDAAEQSVWCFPDAVPDDFYGGWRLQVDADVRKTAVGALARLPVGAWVQIDDAALDRLVPPPSKSLLNPYIVQYFSWREHAGVEAIQRYTVELVRATLAWELAAFGAVRVDSDSRASGKPLVLCLTELGAWLVGSGAPPALPEPAPVVVQPSYEVLVPREATLEAIVAVESAGELVRRDVVSTYRLTKPALVAAVERGLTVERVTDLLESASGHALPANVAHTLRDWASAYGRIRVARGPFLVADSAPLLAELRASKKLSGMVGDALGDRVAEVPARHVSALAKKLRELGHVPLVDDDVQPETGAGASRQRWGYGPAQFDGDELAALFVAVELVLSLPTLEEGLPGGDDFLDVLEELRDKIYDVAPGRARRTMDQVSERLDSMMAALEAGQESGDAWADDAGPDEHGRPLRLLNPPARRRTKT